MSIAKDSEAQRERERWWLGRRSSTDIIKHFSTDYNSARKIQIPRRFKAIVGMTAASPGHNCKSRLSIPAFLAGLKAGSKLLLVYWKQSIILPAPALIRRHRGKPDHCWQWGPNWLSRTSGGAVFRCLCQRVLSLETPRCTPRVNAAVVTLIT